MEGSGGPTGGLEGIGSPNWKFGRGCEANPEVREGLGWVRMPTRRSGRGREVHPVDREGSGGPPGGQVGIERNTRRSGQCHEAHTEARLG